MTSSDVRSAAQSSVRSVDHVAIAVEHLHGAVELSPRGEVVIDDHGRTSMPGVFAAGDCTTVPYKQIVIALGAGSTAALSAFDHLIRSPLATETVETATTAGAEFAESAA